MTIETIVENEKITVKIGGRLDTTTAPDLETELDNILDSAKELIIDMSGLEYIASAGLRLILKAQKAMNVNGSMKIVGANDDIMEVFDITGFIDILTIE